MMMTMRRFLALGTLLLATLALGGCGYNDFQRLDEQTKAAWSEVLNQYQRRADLVPNIVATVKGEANFEQETLIRVVEARAKATAIQVTPETLNNPEAFNKFQQAQGELSGALSRLMVVSERGGQRIESLVHQVQRVHQLVFEQLDDLLAGEVHFELRLRHQAHALVVHHRARARIAPLVECGFQRFAIAVRQFQRALVQQPDRDPVVVDRAVLVAGDGGEPHLLFDIAPESGEHARKRCHRVAADRLESAIGGLARLW